MLIKNRVLIQNSTWSANIREACLILLAVGTIFTANLALNKSVAVSNRFDKEAEFAHAYREAVEHNPRCH